MTDNVLDLTKGTVCSAGTDFLTTNSSDGTNLLTLEEIQRSIAALTLSEVILRLSITKQPSASTPAAEGKGEVK